MSQSSVQVTGVEQPADMAARPQGVHAWAVDTAGRWRTSQVVPEAAGRVPPGCRVRSR